MYAPNQSEPAIHCITGPDRPPADTEWDLVNPDSVDAVDAGHRSAPEACI